MGGEMEVEKEMEREGGNREDGGDRMDQTKGRMECVRDRAKETIDSIRTIKFRRVFDQAVAFGLVATAALMIWKALMCVSGSQSPLVVVVSESMEPGFQRGDILFLYMDKEPIRSGEIVVYNIDGHAIPIVHRVIEVHDERGTGEFYFLTKGDNNYDDDRSLYPEDQFWLEEKQIMGKAIGLLPYVGWFTIIMTEIPYIKYVMIGLLALLVVTSND